MDIEDIRWRWYFEGLSSETREFMYAMSEDAWQAWLPRASELSYKRGVKGIEDSFVFDPPLAPWERECLEAMRNLSDDDVEPEPHDMGFLVQLLPATATKAREYFANMTKPQWDLWQPRYKKLVAAAAGQHRAQFESDNDWWRHFLQDTTWWEQEFLEAMLSHPGMAEQYEKRMRNKF